MFLSFSPSGGTTFAQRVVISHRRSFQQQQAGILGGRDCFGPFASLLRSMQYIIIHTIDRLFSPIFSDFQGIAPLKCSLRERRVQRDKEHAYFSIVLMRLLPDMGGSLFLFDALFE